jgi:thymidylate kinase
MKPPKRLVILEGPDGAGKTTLGQELHARLGVHITNHGPYKGEAQIWRHYFESMLPAYSGVRDVILDRCWIAEPIYGKVYRGGLNRIEPWQLRILEYVADNCKLRVVLCLPPVTECIRNFNSRREMEMLDNEAQLVAVYNEYAEAWKKLSAWAEVIRYDYTRDDAERAIYHACR